MTSFPQLSIIHVSDLHFGAKNICRPEDQTGSARGIPSLEVLLQNDLAGEELQRFVLYNGSDTHKQAPVILAATGDLTQTCSKAEFDHACKFLTHFTTCDLLGRRLGINDVFVVPGNHDVEYQNSTSEHRFGNYCNFYNKLYKDMQPQGRPYARPEEAELLTSVRVVPEKSLVVAEINSCYYVEKETEDESRGQVDMAAISSLRRQLSGIKSTDEFIKVALIHHHPVLLPSFVEAGRGVDAVLNARSLLTVLRQHGFQLILHGHKHFPQVFSYDPDTAWGTTNPVTPQLVVAGGSLGSNELPDGLQRSNTYNLITIKWDGRSRQGRVQVVTRGLCRTDAVGALDPDLWKWTTLRVFNRVLAPHESLPSPRVGTRIGRPSRGDSFEKRRKRVYAECRLNMPVAEVIPSLMPGQGYEVRAWLVQHKYHSEFPVKVTWSAGPEFDRKVFEQDAGPDYCVSFHYWGAMLVQAQMHFADGKTALAHVYARLPG